MEMDQEGELSIHANNNHQSGSESGSIVEESIEQINQ